MNQRVKVLGLVLLGAVCRPLGAEPLEDVSRALEAGRFDAAIQTLDRVGPGVPADARKRFLRGAALAGKGKKEEAIKVFKKLIAEFPGQPEPYNNLAALYASQGRLDEAKEVLDRAIRTNKSYATVYDNLNTVYVEMARNSYVKALRLEQTPPLPRLRMLYAFNQRPASAVIADEGSQPSEVVAVVRAGARDKGAGNEPAKETVRLAEVSPAVAEVPPEPRGKMAADTQAVAAPANVVRPEEAPAAVAEVPPAPIEKMAADAPVDAAPADVVQPAETLAAVAGGSGEPQGKAVADMPVEAPSARSGQGSAKIPGAAVASDGGPDGVKSAVLAAMEGWAQAWSAKDVDAYLAYYGQDFVPPGGRTRDAWEGQRRERLTAPEWIRVDVKDVRVTPRSPDRVTVRLVQHYASPGYQDKTLKRFTLVSRDGRWTIKSEKSLEIIR